MIIHRDGWRYSGRVPAFFTGQAGCYCCGGVSGAYWVKCFDNSSTFTELARIDYPASTETARQIRLLGTNVYVGAPGTTENDHVHKYPADLASLTRTYTFTYGPGSGNRSFGVHADRVVQLATRTTGAATPEAVCARLETDGSLEWETSFTAGSLGEGLAAGLAMRSDGTCWGCCTKLGQQNLTRFSTAGAKSMEVNYSTGGFVDVVCASDDFAWVAVTEGAGVLRRINASGTTTHTISLAGGENIRNLAADGSGGVWITTTADRLRHYSSSGTSLANVSVGANMQFNRILCCNPATDDAFIMLSVSGERRVRSYNSSGTENWTTAAGTDLWGAATVECMAANDDYVYLGGGRVAA